MLLESIVIHQETEMLAGRSQRQETIMKLISNTEIQRSHTTIEQQNLKYKGSTGRIEMTVANCNSKLFYTVYNFTMTTTIKLLLVSRMVQHMDIHLLYKRNLSHHDFTCIVFFDSEAWSLQANLIFMIFHSFSFRPANHL